MKITQCFETSGISEITTQRHISEDKFSLFCTIKYADVRTRGTLATASITLSWLRLVEAGLQADPATISFRYLVDKATLAEVIAC